MIKPKPCPSCRSETLNIFELCGTLRRQIACDKCGHTGLIGSDEEGAVRLWNMEPREREQTMGEQTMEEKAKYYYMYICEVCAQNRKENTKCIRLECHPPTECCKSLYVVPKWIETPTEGQANTLVQLWSVEHFDGYEAIERMKAGKKVRRENWAVESQILDHETNISISQLDQEDWYEITR